MSRRRVPLVLSAAFVVLSACDAATVAAPGGDLDGFAANRGFTEVPISGLFDAGTSRITDPGKVWVTNNGILHVRGQQVASPIIGDLSGTLYQVVNLDVDPATGNGRGWGSFHFVGLCNVCPNPAGETRGTFNSDIVAGGATGRFRGTGKFGGDVTQASGTQTQISGPDPAWFLYQGVIRIH